ncbi:unnamed protein product [Schistosoma margrebowiei]|uniref:Uncharacterized protein n=1 Tax=Schistosoma margrebowiei TaxID=48269 RepID=A0A183N7W4_9TREM|nr:unnamed protein product [Schistosoma margrebowiei]
MVLTLEVHVTTLLYSNFYEKMILTHRSLQQHPINSTYHDNKNMGVEIHRDQLTVYNYKL